MRLDMIDLHARQKYRLPDDWAIFQWEALPNVGEATYSKIKGAVAPMKPGQTDGNWGRDWKKRDKSTELILTITFKEHDEFLREWSEKTGNCIKCCGDGRYVVRCGVNIETEYRKCIPCDGTGKTKAEGRAE